MPSQYTSSIVISAMKQIFSEYGIPDRVVSDNGPQFSAFSFKEFAKQWCFDHCTSSPRYPQSNGFVERQIRTVKSLFQKAEQDGSVKCTRTVLLVGKSFPKIRICI